MLSAQLISVVTLINIKNLQGVPISSYGWVSSITEKSRRRRLHLSVPGPTRANHCQAAVKKRCNAPNKKVNTPLVLGIASEQKERMRRPSARTHNLLDSQTVGLYC